MINVFTDGASRGNPGKSAAAVYITDQNNQQIYSAGENIGIATNNIAEYKAVLLAFSWITENPEKIGEQINFFLDSNLVCSQLNGLFKIKNADLRNIYFEIKQKEAMVNKKIIYKHIPREKNKEADRIANLVLDNQF